MKSIKFEFKSNDKYSLFESVSAAKITTVCMVILDYLRNVVFKTPPGRSDYIIPKIAYNKILRMEFPDMDIILCWVPIFKEFLG